MTGRSSVTAATDSSTTSPGRGLGASRAILALSVLSWCGLLVAPVPWVLSGTPTGPLPRLDYGLGVVIVFGAVVALFAGLALVASSPRGSQGSTRAGVLVSLASAPVSAWLWALIVIGSFDRSVVLARHENEYQAMDEACRKAGASPTMAERRRSSETLPRPPDDWTSSTSCADLTYEVASFEADRKCPRFLPSDPCECGGQEWPADSPPCDGGAVLCARVPGDTYDSSARLQCVR